MKYIFAIFIVLSYQGSAAAEGVPVAQAKPLSELSLEISTAAQNVAANPSQLSRMNVVLDRYAADTQAASTLVYTKIYASSTDDLAAPAVQQLQQDISSIRSILASLNALTSGLPSLNESTAWADRNMGPLKRPLEQLQILKESLSKTERAYGGLELRVAAKNAPLEPTSNSASGNQSTGQGTVVASEASRRWPADIAACKGLGGELGKPALTYESACVAMLSYWTEISRAQRYNAESASNSILDKMKGIIGKEVVERAMIDKAFAPRWREIETQRVVAIKCAASSVSKQHAGCLVRAERTEWLTDGRGFKTKISDSRTVFEDRMILTDRSGYWYPDRSYKTAAEEGASKAEQEDSGNFSPEDCEPIGSMKPYHEVQRCKAQNEQNRREYDDTLAKSKEYARSNDKRAGWSRAIVELKIGAL